MELVILCLLSWPWTPGTALPRNLGRAGRFLIEQQVNQLSGTEWSGAGGGTQNSATAPGGARKAKARQESGRTESPRTAAGDRGAGWDFSPWFVLISALALLVTSHCCFHHIASGSRLFSRVRRGCLRNCRGLPRITVVDSLQHAAVFVPRAPRGLAAENCWEVRLAPSVLYSEPFVHFRRGARGAAAKDRSGPLPLAAPAGGVTSVTILEMENDL